MGVGLERLGAEHHPVCSPGTFQFSSCGLSDCLHAGVLQRDASRHIEGERKGQKIRMGCLVLHLKNT